MNRKGSCLLFFVLFSMIISFLCLTMWHSIVALYETVLQKQRYEQHKHYVEGVLRLGTTLCCNHFDTLVEQLNIHKACLVFDIACEQDQKLYDEAQLSCTKQIKKNNEYYLKLNAIVASKKNKRMQASCKIIKQYDAAHDQTTYKVKQWCIHDHIGLS